MTVTTTPANILPADAVGGTWVVQNLGPADVFLARSQAECTAQDGVKIAALEAIDFTLPTSVSAIWAVTAAGTADVRIVKSR